MTRPLRLVVPGGLYHVVTRGNERKAIFRDDDDRRSYLARLMHYRERDGFRLLAYCLMDNHVHLAIETAEISLSKTMAGLQSSYTQAFNRRHRRVGHLFQGRYKATLVDKESYGQVLIRYIHRNPVEARFVRREADFAWSSARFWRLGMAPAWLDLAAGLRLFGSTPKRGLASYRDFARVSGAPSYDEIPTHGQQVMGSDEFVDSLPRPRAVAIRGLRRIPLDAVVRQVADEEKVSVAQLRARGNGRRMARIRAIVALRALALGGVSIARTARFFGRDGSSLTRAVARLEDERAAE